MCLTLIVIDLGPFPSPALVSMWLLVQAGGRQIGGEQGSPSNALSRHQLGVCLEAQTPLLSPPDPTRGGKSSAGAAATGTTLHS